jgi:hypothetical protein
MASRQTHRESLDPSSSSSEDEKDLIKIGKLEQKREKIILLNSPSAQLEKQKKTLDILHINNQIKEAQMAATSTYEKKLKGISRCKWVPIRGLKIPCTEPPSPNSKDGCCSKHQNSMDKRKKRLENSNNLESRLESLLGRKWEPSYGVSGTDGRKWEPELDGHVQTEEVDDENVNELIEKLQGISTPKSVEKRTAAPSPPKVPISPESVEAGRNEQIRTIGKRTKLKKEICRTILEHNHWYYDDCDKYIQEQAHLIIFSEGTEQPFEREEDLYIVLNLAEELDIDIWESFVLLYLNGWNENVVRSSFKTR